VRKLTAKILDVLPKKLIDKLKMAIFWRAYVWFKIAGKAPYPKTIIIDPVNFCMLKCPLCPTGTGKLECEKAMMKFELFKKIVDQIPTLKHISLFNWGEPFLNSEIFKMINYANKKNILVSVHSNFNLKKDASFFKKIIQNPPDNLEISLDGASGKSYEKYRQGGNFDLVLGNLRKLADEKKKAKSKKPRIIWKFIVNKYNEHEIGKARKKAKDLGIEFALETIEAGDLHPGIKFEGSVKQRIAKWLPQKKRYVRSYYKGKYELPLFKRKCDQIFTTLAVGPDGKVFPCCFVVRDRDAFGDLNKESFEKIWNNEKFSYARNLFAKRKLKDGQKTSCVCDVCTNFQKLSSKKSRTRIFLKYVFGIVSTVVIGFLVGFYAAKYSIAAFDRLRVFVDRKVLQEQKEHVQEIKKYVAEIGIISNQLGEILDEMEEEKKLELERKKQVADILNQLSEASVKIDREYLRYVNDSTIQYYPFRSRVCEKKIQVTWHLPAVTERLIRSVEYNLYMHQPSEDSLELARKNLRIVNNQIEKFKNIEI
jgi:radical SAM protein with 4Fe4S-binding SPASM domain